MMQSNRFLIALLVALTGFLVCTAGIRSDPTQTPGAAILEVVNESGKRFTFTATDLAKLPQQELKAKDHCGDEAAYSGVLVAEVLKKADVTLGERLRGKLLVNHLLVEAADKYRVVFSIPEIDPGWTDKVVLLAVKRNGQPLDEKHGPLQLVVPGDKRHSRWVKQVVRITVQSDSK
jgi:DMSO/TMAO reductase YedYZ molybdopterin-dependent catalytic subunit